MTTLHPVHDLDTFVATRDALHRVAEHVLAAARYADDREIRLMAYPGGFSTPLLGDGSRVRVDVADLVVDERDGSRRQSLSTIDSAAKFAGIAPGFPTQLYEPATEIRGDEPLNIDHDAAETLAAWYGFTADVLDAFAAELSSADDHANPSQRILWPEHFDQAFSTEDDVESRRANYGASPGDGGHPQPYLYVGPWGSAAADPFWNAPHFNGAVLALADLVAAADQHHTALQFLRTGRSLLV